MMMMMEKSTKCLLEIIMEVLVLMAYFRIKLGN